MLFKSKAKGNTFERRAAHDLREVYDSSDLIEQTKLATGSDKSLLMKQSAVRRSDQGKGALEPDVVVRGCPFWIECQDSRQANPIAKLEQAERDTIQSNSSLVPVSVTHQTGSHSITVAIRAYHLEKYLKYFPITSVVCFEWEDFLAALETIKNED